MGRLIDLETLRCHGLRSTVGNLTQQTTEGLPAHLARLSHWQSQARDGVPGSRLMPGPGSGPELQ